MFSLEVVVWGSCQDMTIRTPIINSREITTPARAVKWRVLRPCYSTWPSDISRDFSTGPQSPEEMPQDIKHVNTMLFKKKCEKLASVTKMATLYQ